MNPALTLPSLLALLACLLQIGNDASWKERFAISTERWQENKACGPNCLYVFLRALGREVDHDELVKTLPASDKGVSLAALQEAASWYGVRTEAVRAGPEALSGLSLPAILHMGEGDEDHFVVLCELNQDQALVVDGGNGEVMRMELSRLVREWSGYALVAAEPRWVTYSRLGVYVAAGVAGVLVSRRWFLPQRRASIQEEVQVAGAESSKPR